LVVAWFDSLDKRGKQQGWVNVFLGDLSMAMNITSWFISMFMMVISAVREAILSLAGMVGL